MNRRILCLMLIRLLIRRLPNLLVMDSLHDDQKVEVPLTVCFVNVKSFRNKAIYVAVYVVSQDIDAYALTETWIRTGTDQLTINELVPGGYEINHIPPKRSRWYWHILQNGTNCHGE